MSVKEYVVSLQKGVDYDQFWSEMESDTNGLTFVPNRKIDIVNNRDGSTRNCHYALTDEEAQLLRDDPRVLGVDIPVSQKEYVKITPFSTTQPGNYTKPATQDDSNNTYLNWGLIRHSNNTNVYGTSTTTPLQYIYDLDGTGVDIVISDTGLQVDHPEFQDASGNSRVQLINWYTESGITGTQSANHYRDYDGHGTHVAGTAAGKTYGWAKNARIYSVKVSGLEGSGDSGTGISAVDCMDVIKLWHRNKPVNPETGYKRPTIVNMSWGYTIAYQFITGGRYRGTTWTGTTPDINKGMYYPRASSYRDTATDVDLEELLDEGVIVCVAAGNNSHKIDVPSGIDYNNYWTRTGVGNIYYHRGCSPFSSRALIVGSLNNSTYDTTLDKKASYSNGGPGIDIYAAGTYIMSSTSTVNQFPVGSYVDYPYYGNPTFRQLNLSGTSMASPQICGIGALYLQNNPTANSTVLKSIIQSNGTYTVYSSGSDNDYNNLASQWGGNVKVAYISTLSAANVANTVVINTSPIWSGTGGFATVSFTRTPPAIKNRKLGKTTVLIVGATSLSSYANEVLNVLNTRLSAQGYTTTYANTYASLPADLSSYGQIWDVSVDITGYGNGGVVIPNDATTKYTSYLQQGGALFLLGENSAGTSTAWDPRNESIATFITNMGGGTVATNVSEVNQLLRLTVDSQFRIANSDSTVSIDWGGQYNSIGTGTRITVEHGVAVCWKTGSLSNAPAGAIVSVLDINFLTNSNQYYENTFVDNLIATLNSK
jgi:hypothetical protein